MLYFVFLEQNQIHEKCRPTPSSPLYLIAQEKVELLFPKGHHEPILCMAQRNGVFTYSILQGINSKKADINRDKKVSIEELQKYVTFTVNSLTGGKQLPTTRHVNRYGNFSVYKY